MNAQIFVDTGAWVALADTSDNLHVAAKDSYAAILIPCRRLVTTNLVVAETYNLLRRRLGHKAAVRFLATLKRSPRLQNIYSNEVLEREAEEILARYGDQDFSFVDAVSLAYMKQQQIAQAFAFDHHFLVAGFMILPAST